MPPEDRRTRVLFVISDLSGGGAERVVSTYLRHLDRNRFEPGLCLWRPVFAYEVPGDVPQWTVHKWRPWDAPAATWRTGRVLRRFAPDIVFSHLEFPNLLTGAALRLSRSRAAWIPCIHNNPRRQHRPWRPALRRLYRTAEAVGFVSRKLAEQTADYCGIPAAKTVTLHNPIDFGFIDDRCREPEPDLPPGPTIVSMGRLVPQKDHATLLRAAAALRETQPVNVFLMGTGPLRGELEQLADELGIRDAVTFAGFVDNPFPYLSAADVFVLSSRWEGFGNVLVEALGCGTAAVSTDCPFGPSEIIEDGETGLLVPVGGPDALADAVGQLLRSPERRRRMAAAGREDVRRRFSARQRTRALEQLFEQVRGEGA